MGRLSAIRCAVRTVVDSIWSGQLSNVRRTLSAKIIEPLEARTLLSTYTVNSLADDGTAGVDHVGPLRWVISQANAAGGDQTINFSSGLSGTISLASALPAISSNITIDGSAAGDLSIDGNSHGPVIAIDAGVVAEIDGLTITGGHATYGGNINNSGDLTISNSTITGGTATRRGGDIYNAYDTGSLTVIDSIISGGAARNGGGISSAGDLTVSDSIISGNTTTLPGGGLDLSGNASINSSTVSGNSGCGIAVYSGYTTIVDSTISGNSAVHNCGGGGLYNYGTVDVINSTFAGNTSRYDAAAIWNRNTLTLTDCTITGNSGVLSSGDVVSENFASCTIHGTIIAQNTDGTLSGPFTGSDNLIGGITSPATVNEGSSSAVSVSSSTVDGISWPVDHWLIDWNDGTNGGSDPATISGASGSTSAHSFPSGTGWADVTITAVDSHDNTFTLPDQFIDVVPTAPSDVHMAAVNEGEVDLTWTDNSSSENGFTILRSDDNGVTYTAVGYANADATSYADTGLDASTSYQYKVEASGGSSGTASSSGSQGTTTDDSGGSGGGGGDEGGGGGGGGSGSDSVATPSGKPSLTAEPGPTGSGSAILTWTYDGNDGSSFELEMKDTTTGENYYFIDAPGAVGSNGSGSFTETGLTFDDSYSFRIRADHSDGTVSEYDGSGSVTPTGGAAPSISATADNDGSDYFILLHWEPPSGSVVSYDVQWKGSRLTGHGYTELANPSNDMTFDIGQGQTGKFRVRALMADGTVTKWGESEEVTEGGSAGTPPTVTADAVSDTAIDVTFRSNPSGVIGDISYFVSYSVYDAQGSDGIDITPAINFFAADATGTAHVTGLAPGTKYDFKVFASWHAEPIGDSHDDAGMGLKHADATTTGTASGSIPATPDGFSGVLDPKESNQIDLRWRNTPNNETGYRILRSIDGGDFESIGSTGADETTLKDELPDDFRPGEALAYEVEAINTAGTSALATTQPSTQATIIAKARGDQFQVWYKGPGTPKFLQTVSISGNPVTPQLRANEKAEHGGKDPFSGPVGDNPSGDPDQPYGGMIDQSQGGWTMLDVPTFDPPSYPANFAGTKSFVTTVKDAAGNVLKTITWHSTRAAKGHPVTTIDSQ